MKEGCTPSSRSRIRLAVAGALFIVAATVVVYWPAMNGGPLWDDAGYIAENPLLVDWAGLRQIWFDPRSQPQYYPLTFTAFWIEHQLWGPRTLGYHAVNVGLHALGAVLLWLVLHRLRVPGAFVAAALFALHPVQVASVAWIAERKNVLAGVFYFLALLAWLRFNRTRSWLSYAAVLPLFIAALLSKTAICTFPLVVVLFTWWRWPQRLRRAALAAVPLLTLAVALGLLTVWRERQHHSGAGFVADFTLIEAVLTAGRALWFYVGKLVYPTELMAIYPKWRVDSASVWPYAYLLGMAAMIVALWALRHRWGKGPLIGVLSFVITLGPALGLIDFGFRAHSYVADHFQYLACVGVLAAIVGGISSGLRRVGVGALRVGTVLAAALLITLGILSWRHAANFSSPGAFWSYNVARNPTHTAYSALGDVYLRAAHTEPDPAARRQKLETAESYQRQSLAILDNALARVRLGSIYVARGENRQALREFEYALSRAPGGGLHEVRSKTLFNMGAAYWNLGQPVLAARYWRETLRVEPRSQVAREWLARADALLTGRRARRTDEP